MISITSKGSFSHLDAFLAKMKSGVVFNALEQYGQRGVDALSAATPVETGETAGAWSYEVTQDKGGYSIVWTNSHVNEGVPIAVILQYGHGTGTGGYVNGRDYINPAMRPIFDQIADAAWKVVTSA